MSCESRCNCLDSCSCHIFKQLMLPNCHKATSYVAPWKFCQKDENWYTVQWHLIITSDLVKIILCLILLQDRHRRPMNAGICKPAQLACCCVIYLPQQSTLTTKTLTAVGRTAMANRELCVFIWCGCLTLVFDCALLKENEVFHLLAALLLNVSRPVRSSVVFIGCTKWSNLKWNEVGCFQLLILDDCAVIITVIVGV